MGWIQVTGNARTWAQAAALIGLTSSAIRSCDR
jgi:hypothetical protein